MRCLAPQGGGRAVLPGYSHHGHTQTPPLEEKPQLRHSPRPRPGGLQKENAASSSYLSKTQQHHEPEQVPRSDSIRYVVLLDLILSCVHVSSTRTETLPGWAWM